MLKLENRLLKPILTVNQHIKGGYIFSLFYSHIIILFTHSINLYTQTKTKLNR
jgi:hypothetical protein